MLSYDLEANFQYFTIKKYFERKNKKFEFIKFFLMFDNFLNFKEDWSMQKEIQKMLLIYMKK